jgi:hypothetical protein
VVYVGFVVNDLRPHIWQMVLVTVVWIVIEIITQIMMVYVDSLAAVIYLIIFR